MRATFACLILALTFALPSIGQGREQSAVVNPQYKIAGQRLAVAFPKKPVYSKFEDGCTQTQGGRYYAYAGDAVYQFGWYAERFQPRYPGCGKTEVFSRKLYENEIARLKESPGHIESDVNLFGKAGKLIRWSDNGTEMARWLVWVENGWIEMAITRRKDATVDESKFLKGVSRPDASSIDVGKGAYRTFGDADAVDGKEIGTEKDSYPFMILHKPRPPYTDVARSKNTQGKVVLRVTFLHNGGIGSIEVVEPLKHGLTEQAVTAASTIVFLPKRDAGKNVSITKMVEYGFSIY
jgi:hypothetical protein